MAIELSQANNPDRFTARHWMFIPIERVTQPPNPPTGTPYRGLVILSGVALINLKGTSPGAWLRDRIILNLGVDLSRAIALAPWRPSRQGYFFAFTVEQWAPFVTVNARYNQGPADNDGSAVDSFWLDSGHGAVINADVAVRDSDAYIYRLGYTLNLYGQLVEQPPVP